MSDNEYKKDRDLRKDRQERVNTALRKAAQWIEKIPPLADRRALELSLLTSKNVPEIDEEYDMTIVQATIDKVEVDTLERIQQEEDVRIREVSPEPEKSPERQTSTPKQSAYVPPDKRRVTFDQTERLNTIGGRPEVRAAQHARQEVGNRHMRIQGTIRVRVNWKEQERYLTRNNKKTPFFGSRTTIKRRFHYSQAH